MTRPFRNQKYLCALLAIAGFTNARADVPSVSSATGGAFTLDNHIDDFADCMSGVIDAMTTAPTCLAAFDRNRDGDVDLADFADLSLIAPAEDMALIRAGTFQMGDTFDEGGKDERPVHSVFLDGYYIDAYEVTNGEYVEALNWALAQGDQIYFYDGFVYGNTTTLPYCYTLEYYFDSSISWTGNAFTVKSGREDHPMVGVSWYGAAAYCNWRSVRAGRTPAYDENGWRCDFSADGFRLPTEAEWEKAARGGLCGQRFQWGNLIDHERANYFSATDQPYDISATQGNHPDFDDSGYPYTSPVGSFTPNGYGLYDVAGNVRELCYDGYDYSYYRLNPPDDWPPNPIVHDSDNFQDYRVIRGGSWNDSAYGCRVALRVRFPRSSWPGANGILGFRCAATAP
jgi:formylglycine-generating enzyme required for sulfatase activity